MRDSLTAKRRKFVNSWLMLHTNLIIIKKFDQRADESSLSWEVLNLATIKTIAKISILFLGTEIKMKVILKRRHFFDCSSNKNKCFLAINKSSDNPILDPQLILSLHRWYFHWLEKEEETQILIRAWNGWPNVVTITLI